MALMDQDLQDIHGEALRRRERGRAAQASALSRLKRALDRKELDPGRVAVAKAAAEVAVAAVEPAGTVPVGLDRLRELCALAEEGVVIVDAAWLAKVAARARQG